MSQIPRELLPLATHFRAANVFTSLPAAMELHGLTGLPLANLVAFRPQRLALHELLIRVTADLEVPDGLAIGDLGINFRAIVNRLWSQHVVPRESSFLEAYAKARRELAGAIETTHARVVGSSTRDWGAAQCAALDAAAADAPDGLGAVAARTLSEVMGALFQTHGRSWGTGPLLVSIATDVASNEYCSAAIGQALAPLMAGAAASEGYRFLPSQTRPVVINTKGASASGKSTLRPLQKALAADIGVDWRDFALISPDIWRKQLLDYTSLGAHYKYAGAFTALEVRIVDQKLDRYMARKHERVGMSHLLIDRFRFDSFAPNSEEAGSNLLTRFGQSVYLFLVVTPPELLVERAWKRGLEFGRYKAVDDTLAHSVEANRGIPDMFFTWVRRPDKQLRFEFLDNTVAFGERPRTIAFGDNDTFNLLSARCLSDIQRFGRINIDARAADELFPHPDAQAPANNTSFLRRCLQEFRRVNFVEQATGRVYLRIEAGAVVWVDPAALDVALDDIDTRVGLAQVAPGAVTQGLRNAHKPEYLPTHPASQTLGDWGRARPGQ